MPDRIRPKTVTEIPDEPIKGVVRVDWKANPHDVLKMVNGQLVEYGLEVVSVRYEGDSIIWFIRPMVKE
jgi:hypothetical protein